MANGNGENSLGTAGFICSLLGLIISCGILSPVGLVMSLIALKKQPRGLATAGVVLGIIGSLWLIAALVFGLFAVILGALGIAAGSGAHP